jgi:hypothetical protein
VARRRGSSSRRRSSPEGDHARNVRGRALAIHSCRPGAARDRVAAAERRIDNDRRSNPNVEHAGWSWRSSNCPIFESQLRLRGLLEARSSSPDIPDQTLPERIKCKLGCPSRAISGADKLALRGVTCVRDRFFFLRLSIGAARPTTGEFSRPPLPAT